jgi:hypothetical protein
MGTNLSLSLEADITRPSDKAREITSVVLKMGEMWVVR